jgi:hypothetical protein
LKHRSEVGSSYGTLYADDLLQYFAYPSLSDNISLLARVEVLKLSNLSFSGTDIVLIIAKELREFTMLELDFQNQALDEDWLYLLANPPTSDMVGPGTVFFPKLRSSHLHYFGPKTAIRVTEWRYRSGVPLEEFHLLNTLPLAVFAREKQHLHGYVGKLCVHELRPELAENFIPKDVTAAIYDEYICLHRYGYGYDDMQPSSLSKLSSYFCGIWKPCPYLCQITSSICMRVRPISHLQHCTVQSVRYNLGPANLT